MNAKMEFAYLPTEIKQQIFSYMDSKNLKHTLTEVCSEWDSIVSDNVLRKRVDNIYKRLSDAGVIQLRSRIPPSLQGNDLCLLAEFERSYLSSKYSLKLQNFLYAYSPNSNVMDSFLHDTWASRRCDCMETDLCVIRALHFMTCHQLLVVQVPEQLTFYSMRDLFPPSTTSLDKDELEYTTKLKGADANGSPDFPLWIENNTHGAVSTFGSYVVCQQNTRILKLYKVVEVDNTKREIFVERARKIYLPLWSCAILMLESKVFVLFSTGSTGIWNMNGDSLHLSTNSLGSLRGLQLARLYSVNSLVLIKIITDDEPRATWSICDTTGETFALHGVVMVDLIKSGLLEANEKCTEVIDLFVSLNAIIIHCTVNLEPSSSKSDVEKVLVRRLEKNPILEDFLDPLKFKALFVSESTNSEPSYLREINFRGSLSVPFVSGCASQVLQDTLSEKTDSSHWKECSEPMPALSFLSLLRPDPRKMKNQIRALNIDVLNL